MHWIITGLSRSFLPLALIPSSRTGTVSFYFLISCIDLGQDVWQATITAHCAAADGAMTALFELRAGQTSVDLCMLQPESKTARRVLQALVAECGQARFWGDLNIQARLHEHDCHSVCDGKIISVLRGAS
jgi:hypothetical protein